MTKSVSGTVIPVYFRPAGPRPADNPDPARPAVHIVQDHPDGSQTITIVTQGGKAKAFDLTATEAAMLLSIFKGKRPRTVDYSNLADALFP